MEIKLVIPSKKLNPEYSLYIWKKFNVLATDKSKSLEKYPDSGGKIVCMGEGTQSDEICYDIMILHGELCKLERERWDGSLWSL